MSVSVFVKRMINGAEVTFDTEADSLSAALAMAQQLAGDAAPQETKSAKKSSNAGTASTEKSSQASAPTPEKSSAETKPEETKAITYDEVKNAVLELSKKSRAKAEALLSRYGVARANFLTEEQWPKFHADAVRVIAGEYDPEAGE